MLRIVVGGFVTGISLSHWIVLTTFLLSLFLASAKRLDDVTIFESSGAKVRKNVEHYNIDYLYQSIALSGSVTLMCYILYTVSDDVVKRIGNHYLYATSFFVLAGILRYSGRMPLSGASGRLSSRPCVRFPLAIRIPKEGAGGGRVARKCPEALRPFLWISK